MTAQFLELSELSWWSLASINHSTPLEAVCNNEEGCCSGSMKSLGVFVTKTSDYNWHTEWKEFALMYEQITLPIKQIMGKPDS